MLKPRQSKTSKTDWEYLRQMADDEIEQAALSDPDALPLPAEFWKDAKVVMPSPKHVITIRVSGPVLDFFKRQGKGYQSRMNAVLEAYVKAQQA
jgi:uncharacterized protein (DUF4415 family)